MIRVRFGNAQSSDGSLIVVLSHLNILNSSSELNIHVGTSKKRVYWQVYRFVLVIARDIQTVQNTQAPEFSKVLPDGTPILRSTMPWLKAEPGGTREVR